MAGAFFRTEDDDIVEAKYLEDEDTTVTGTSHSGNDSDDSTTMSLIQWKSTDRQSFYQNQPLFVPDPDEDTTPPPNEVAALQQALKRSRQLPGTGYYCNNHILVNQERRVRQIAPLSRLSELDELARAQAQAMANDNRLSHSDPTALHTSFSRRRRIMGENVACGRSIRDIHTKMLQDPTQMGNIVQRRYTHFGMGTARSRDGKHLFLCQLFRG